MKTLLSQKHALLFKSDVEITHFLPFFFIFFLSKKQNNLSEQNEVYHKSTKIIS